MVAARAIALNRDTWSHVDQFIALSEFGKGRFVAGGLPAEKIHVKPHFVADPGLRESEPASSHSLLFVGRLSPEKGIEVLLEAWRALGKTNLKLVFIGDGPLMGLIRQSQNPRVESLGQLKPELVREQMLKARALVFPSIWYETFGLTIVEAFAAGLPVVASNLGGTPDLLGPSNQHWLFEPGNALDLASKLRWLEQDSVVNSAGATARRLYLDRFTPEHGLIALENLYRSVLTNEAR